MRFERLLTSRFETNCYLVWDARTKEAVVIDPGESSATILAEARRRGLRIIAIALTHSHFDHLGAAAELQEESGAPIFRHPRGQELDGHAISKSLAGKRVEELPHGASLTFGAQQLDVIHTPGHAPGAVCFHHRSGVLFTGDLLFAGSVGRTGIPGGEPQRLVESLTERLRKLPDETRVLPGHGTETILGRERERPRSHLNDADGSMTPWRSTASCGRSSAG